MTPRFIDLYYEWMEKGELPGLGLCNCLTHGLHEEMIHLFEPTGREKVILKIEGCDEVFWASGVPKNDELEFYGFTPLRETIILFMAAINNEL